MFGVQWSDILVERGKFTEILKSLPGLYIYSLPWLNLDGVGDGNAAPTGAFLHLSFAIIFRSSGAMQIIAFVFNSVPLEGAGWEEQLF